MEKTLHPLIKNSLLVLLLGLLTFTSCKKDSEIVYPSPYAYFSFDESDAYVDVEISFDNLSENATTYEWNFGDGNTSNEKNPKHTYTQEGEYTLTLMASGDGGDVEKELTIDIKKQTVIGYWVLVEATFDGTALVNTSGFFDVTDAENYSAEFIAGDNKGKATAKYTKFSPLFLSNINSALAITNGKSSVGTSTMQLWLTEIFCDKTVYNNYLNIGLGMGKPELLFEGKYLFLRSSNGKAILKYQKE